MATTDNQDNFGLPAPGPYTLRAPPTADREVPLEGIFRLLPPAHHRKSRARVACALCHGRRVRCSMSRAGCAQCRKGGTDCVYEVYDADRNLLATNLVWGPRLAPLGNELAALTGLPPPRVPPADPPAPPRAARTAACRAAPPAASPVAPPAARPTPLPVAAPASLPAGPPAPPAAAAAVPATASTARPDWDTIIRGLTAEDFVCSGHLPVDEGLFVGWEGFPDSGGGLGDPSPPPAAAPATAPQGLYAGLYAGPQVQPVADPAQGPYAGQYFDSADAPAQGPYAGQHFHPLAPAAAPALGFNFAAPVTAPLPPAGANDKFYWVTDEGDIVVLGDEEMQQIVW